MTKTVPMLSLADLNARAASDTPFEFEYITTKGEPTGVFFSVLGGQSKVVQDEANKAVNARRRAEAVQTAQAKTSRDSDNYTPVEDDKAFGQRLAAIRLTGWRGIAEDFTPELGLALCQNNDDAAAVILQKSNDMGNFMKLSSPKP